jgi:predicted Zn finger-like uncharacterized protein
MYIVCPHCTTSYAIEASTLGEAGRTVRCARCKEVWLARLQDAAQVPAPVPAQVRAEAETEVRVAAMAAAPPQGGLDSDPGWGELGDDDDTPVVDSPSIASAMPEAAVEPPAPQAEPEWSAPAAEEDEAAPVRFARPRKASRVRRLLDPVAKLLRPAKAVLSLPIGCAAMAALVLALMIWRIDVVRLLPQTAGFYRLAGLDVNLRGLEIKDVKISTEAVDGKSVLVIEGAIFDVTRKPVDLPRLRFVVRDEHGTEIYAWNAVLEQSVLKPGEKAWFRSRLASPPAEARSIDVRFFSRRDIGAGAV